VTTVHGIVQIGRAVAAHGLAGTLVEFPNEPLDDAPWRVLLGYCTGQRIPGYLLEAALDGALPTTPAQLDEVREAHLSSMWTVLLIEQTLLKIADQLDAADVDFRVLKGSACAVLDYPDPSLRSFGDVDLLVAPDDFDAAVRALVGHGHRRRFAEPRPGFDRRFSKGASFVTDDDFEVDLHRTFVMGPFGLRVDLDDLWRTSTPFQIGGRKLQALGNEERFMHACFHAALGQSEPRLVPQRDVAEMLLFGTLDMTRVHELITHWKAEAVVARAVRLTWDTLKLADVVSLSVWAHRYQPSDRERRALAVYTTRHSSYAAKSLQAVRAIPRLRDKAAFIRALTFPQRSYIQDHRLGFVTRLRRAAGGVRDGRAAS
jgi:hypothetical protein